MHDGAYRFCPRCGQPLSSALLFGRERARCTACGFIHFQNPKVAVAVLVTDGPLHEQYLSLIHISEPTRPY